MHFQNFKILITGGSGFIGTNLLIKWGNTGNKIYNIDIKQSQIQFDNVENILCDILDAEKLAHIVRKVSPDFVIHMAADTKADSRKLKEYKANFLGTYNLVKACNSVKNVKKLILFSTQYVFRDGSNFPKSNIDYKPHTAYGYSKMLTEKICRNTCECNYVIVRPTNVYGPYNENYSKGLFNVMDKKLFFLPSGKLAFKSMIYVKNLLDIVEQILLDKNSDFQTVYLGEHNQCLTKWTSEVQAQINGQSINRIPKTIFKILCLCGEIFNYFGVKFPLNITRYNNMVYDYLAPVTETYQKYDYKYPDIKKNVTETISWYKDSKKQITMQNK